MSSLKISDFEKSQAQNTKIPKERTEFRIQKKETS